MISGLSAIEKAGSLFGAGAPAARPSGPTAETSFAAMVGETATRAVGQLQQAEQVSMQALQGGADTRAVVDAVMSAEQSLQAAIAIRDKIVTAYLEVSRMQI